MEHKKCDPHAVVAHNKSFNIMINKTDEEKGKLKTVEKKRIADMK